MARVQRSYPLCHCSPGPVRKTLVGLAAETAVIMGQF